MRHIITSAPGYRWDFPTSVTSDLRKLLPKLPKHKQKSKHQIENMNVLSLKIYSYVKQRSLCTIKLKIQLNLWPLQWGDLVALFSCLHAGMVWERHISTVLSDCLHPMIKHHKFQGAHFPHPSQSLNDLITVKTSLNVRSLQFPAHLNTYEFRATCYRGLSTPITKTPHEGKMVFDPCSRRRSTEVVWWHTWWLLCD